MQTVEIRTIPGFEEWRDIARSLFKQGIPPQEISWRIAGDIDLLSLLTQDMAEVKYDNSNKSPTFVPKAFLEQAASASCHASTQRFDLLYRILWRLNTENKNLLAYTTDSDVQQLKKLAATVHRDAYKMKAFLRFREVQAEGKSHYIAWYEPEHYSLELALPFFQTRFKNMVWTILTPYRAAHWNGHVIQLSDDIDPSATPTEDSLEKYWLTYYATIFNPARVKRKAMMSQMPKKYWKHMPETVLIDSLIQNAPKQVQNMIEQGSRFTKTDRD